MVKITNVMFDTSCDTCKCNICKYSKTNDCFDCTDCEHGNNHCEQCSMFEE